MHTAEKVAFAIRHNKHLEKLDWLWNQLRPAYDRVSVWIGGGSIQRVMNGTDRMLLSPRWRMISEVYEPEVWRRLMMEVRPGDVVADVGAYVGLYTVALAQRVGPGGRVIAFEPDRMNSAALTEHLELNCVADRVEVRDTAVGETCALVNFSACASSESSIASGNRNRSATAKLSSVKCETLDEVFANRRLDILKIDVEGYEEKVIEGAKHLLSDPDRGPRLLFIEVHPYAWPGIGTTSDSLLSALAACNYQVQDVFGNLIAVIDEYGEVIARRCESTSE